MRPDCVARAERAWAASSSCRRRDVQIQHHTADAIDERLPHRQLRTSKYLEHRPVVVEHERDKLADTVLPSDSDELAQEQRCRATVLMVVGYRERDLGRVPAGDRPNVAADGDQAFIASCADGQDNPDVVAEIDLGQAPKIIGCELAYRMKEPLINAAAIAMFAEKGLALSPSLPK